MTGQIPSPGQTVPGGSQVLLFLGQTPEPETVKVPDFYGMNRQQASDAAGALGLYILVTGNDEISTGVTVTAQNVAKDTEVPAGTTITLVRRPRRETDNGRLKLKKHDGHFRSGMHRGRELLKSKRFSTIPGR